MKTKLNISFILLVLILFSCNKNLRYQNYLNEMEQSFTEKNYNNVEELVDFIINSNDADASELITSAYFQCLVYNEYSQEQNLDLQTHYYYLNKIINIVNYSKSIDYNISLSTSNLLKEKYSLDLISWTEISETKLKEIDNTLEHQNSEFELSDAPLD
ncbi:MAG: hypothetical protein MJ211_09315 [Bacteroidales bacterium]|nr:hypothetical protein [Bacteroidales bacterium]